MRWTAWAAVLLLGCGGGEGEDPISPYYGNDAPHLTCDASEGPCCSPPVGKLECPEGSTYFEQVTELGGSFGCKLESGDFQSGLVVDAAGFVLDHFKYEAGGYHEDCDATGYVEFRSRYAAPQYDDLPLSSCFEYCRDPDPCLDARMCEDQ